MKSTFSLPNLSFNAATLGVASLVLLPVLALPFFEGFLISSKYLLLLIVLLISLVMWAARIITTGKLGLRLNAVSLSFVLFGAVVLISTFTTNAYPFQQLFGMGGIMLTGVLVSLLLGSILPTKSTQSFIDGLAIGGGVLSIATLLEIAGYGPSLWLEAMTGLAFASDTGISTFNLAGSHFIAAQFLAISIIAAIAWTFRNRRMSYLHMALVPVALAGLIATVWLSLPGQVGNPVLLSNTDNWQVALEVLRVPRSAMVGVGPENFGVAYTLFRPATLNASEFWSFRFGQGSNALLTLLTTTGIFGLVTWLMTAYFGIRAARVHQVNNDAFVMSIIVLSIFVLHIIFPLSVLTFMVLSFAIAYLSASFDIKPSEMRLFGHMSHGHLVQDHGRVGQMIVGFTTAGLVLALTYLGYRGFAASAMSLEGVKGIQANDALKVYESQRMAKNLNPFMPSYRRSFATTNLQIASALSAQEEISEADREQVTQLVQQAIREGRAAIELNPSDTRNHQTMANIYRNLIGSADDAAQWTVNSYVDAIQTSPTDPVLRIELGQIFYDAEQYQQAFSLFQQAANLKPDLAAAYFNAARSLESLEDYVNAYVAYQQTLRLLPDDTSPDYLAVEEAMAAIQPLAEEQAEALQAAQAQQAQGQIPGAVAPEASADDGLGSILDANVQQTGQDAINQQSTLPLNEEQAVIDPTPEPAPADGPSDEPAPAKAQQ